MAQQHIVPNSLMPFYLAWQLNPGGSKYNLCFSYHLQNKKEVALLVNKTQELIALKAYLRQTFTLIDEQLVATVHDILPARINYFTTTITNFSRVEENLVKSPHEINHQSSVRLTIINIEDDDTLVALFNIHHIIMDGTSLDNFLIDLNSLINNKQIQEELRDEYLVRLSQEQFLEESVNNPSVNKYIQELNTMMDVLNLSSDPPSDNYLHYTDILPIAVFQKLQAFSQSNSISIFNLLLLAQSIFLAKLFNNDISLLQYPVNVRKNRSINGCFINLVTFSLRLSKKDNYLSVIKAFNDKLPFFKSIAKYKFNNLPNMDSIPSFAVSNYAQPLVLIIAGKMYKAKNYAQLGSSVFGIKYREKTGKLYFSFDVITELLPAYLAGSLLLRFFDYLTKLLNAPLVVLSKTDLIFEEEKRKLLYDFNNTDVAYPADKTLVDLFEIIVEKFPHKIAVKVCDSTLSYYELNMQAEHLAGYLIERGIYANNRVAILIDNRLKMIVSVLAILKTGAAYVPIAPDTPLERIQYILKDTKTDFLLTLPALSEKFNSKINVIDLNKDYSSNNTYAKPFIASTYSACVIYTSGTTGEPKGVLISHANIVNLTLYYIKAFEITHMTNCSKYAGFGFDASIVEIFPALLSGATLHIIPEHEKKDLVAVKNFFIENCIHFGFLPTQLAELFLAVCQDTDLKYLIIAGEKLKKYTPVNFHVVNAYGTTETSVHVTSYFLNKKNPIILIGKPINNAKCYVVDNNLNLLPIGMTGELLVGGDVLSQGYLNLPDMNAKKFIPNRFQNQEEKKQKKNNRLYKTGDLVRWCPDGNLEYIGRNDFQIKIRGHRIELAEIESKLVSYPSIKQAVVIKKNLYDNKYLVAYYTANESLEDSSLHDYLADRLPEYMIPNIFVHLSQFPLTINGKVDRKSLPDAKFKNKSDYVPPSNEYEQIICEAFSSVLGIQKIGVNDNFFDLGGNSIKAITLVAKLQSRCNINVSKVFTLKTPKYITENITFVRNSLRCQLERIKQVYQTKNNKPNLDIEQLKKLDNYFNTLHGLLLHYEQKKITTVLLTGATGFLGCNLLHQLLTSTKYNVFLLVRAQSDQEALERIYKKLQFYFDKKLKPTYYNRLLVLAADIEKSELGLSQEKYQFIAKKVNSIIHCAALTKHYGDPNQFYSANIQSTTHLLELSKLTFSKDFHYISTISVLNIGYVPTYDDYIYTEDDSADNLEGRSNIYVRTKYESEKIVVEYRRHGIKSNIYRVGNLVFMASNHRFQENIENNAFLHQLKSLLTIRMIAPEISMVEISPVDLTAEAIIKLFDKTFLSNHTYHIFNPDLFDLTKFFFENKPLNVRQVSFTTFIDHIIQLFNDPIYQEHIKRYLLHQGWLNESIFPTTKIQIKQDRTQQILSTLGFKWPITESLISEVLSKYLKMEKLHAYNCQNI